MDYIYKYPDVRDVLMVLTASLFNGNDLLNENMALRGWAVLTSRDKQSSEDLQKFLDLNNVKFQAIPGVFGDEIKFKFGQNVKIDDTVQQMCDDRATKRVNQILLTAKNHRIKAAEENVVDTEISKQEILNQLKVGGREVSKKDAVARLKELMRDVGRLPYKEESTQPENLFYCFYFDEDVLDEAQNLMNQVGIPTHKKRNHDGNAYLLYAVPKGQLSDEVVDIVNEFIDTIIEKEKNTRQEALDKLKTMIMSVKYAGYENRPDKYYYFYFPLRSISEAKSLMQIYTGVAPEEHISNGTGIQTTVLRYKTEPKSQDVQTLVEELKKTVALRASAHHKGGRFEI
ncbi:MAG: hypothetical protein J5742_01315 [Alphaproteobacteria bacterium]|nr:hypothetical protein [Alphaproteobacteria bacterium]